MDALREKWTEKARAALPSVLALIQQIESDIEQRAVVNESIIAHMMSEFNAFATIYVCFAITQKQAFKYASGHHTERIDAFIKELPDIRGPTQLHLKYPHTAFTECQRLTARGHILTSLVLLYTNAALNLEDIIASGQKEAQSPHMY